MINIYFDVETIGIENEAAIKSIHAPILTEAKAAMNAIHAPKNYKDEAKIAAWMANEGAAKLEEIEAESQVKIEAAISSTSFDGALGRSIVICAAKDDGSVITFNHADEKLLLGEFDNWINFVCGNKAATFIGHNIVGFDLPFLRKRFMVNGIKPTHQIPFYVKPWGDEVFDTQVKWDSVKRISLHNLAKALNVPSSKDGMDGSMVWDEYRKGNLAGISEYCARDVECTRAIYKKMTFQ